MLSITMTKKKGTTLSPEIGDYVIVEGCGVGCHARLEGFIVDRVWVSESRNVKYNLLTVLNTLKQERFTLKHTVFLDSDAPEGAVNHFF
jgi:hypothetical protein